MVEVYKLVDGKQVTITQLSGLYLSRRDSPVS
jgi:hypothetical protein